MHRRSDDAARVLREAQEKGKGKEGPKTPKKVVARKKAPESAREVSSGSEGDKEEELEEPPACIYCMKKKIKCVPLAGWKVCMTCQKRKMKCEFFKKTTWAIMDGSQKIAEFVWELVALERHQMASLLEKSWYELDICALNLEQAVDKDLMEVDGRVMTLLDMKFRGLEILVELEKRIIANRSRSIVGSYTAHMEHVFEWMNAIQKRTAWNKMVYQIQG
ncbi:hypothetical protein M422DRAFT_257329 [Sphaerobolus stellatus SS14]|uniref:Zn(2)-C6 fungal-type domain-containing protein n=1 Tax=Sphaerobolus stellatus (strain SS14) TaxID=990650 RepID=A0A0C9VPF9_SPHS4|nr:hypothetical protein M422DRAFT_257329 [Sphaerobolus stellatus SS14]